MQFKDLQHFIGRNFIITLEGNETIDYKNKYTEGKLSVFEEDHIELEIERGLDLIEIPNVTYPEDQGMAVYNPLGESAYFFITFVIDAKNIEKFLYDGHNFIIVLKDKRVPNKIKRKTIPRRKFE